LESRICFHPLACERTAAAKEIPAMHLVDAEVVDGAGNRWYAVVSSHKYIRYKVNEY
jgi:hypothetical protein